jgi:CheY-like chemotaxis protein
MIKTPQPKKLVYHIDDEQAVLDSAQKKAPNLDFIGYTQVMLFCMRIINEISGRRRDNILCILSDHNMPGISGSIIPKQINTINEFLEKKRISPVPFIVMTADSSQTTEKFYQLSSPYYAGRILKAGKKAPDQLDTELERLTMIWLIQQAA